MPQISRFFGIIIFMFYDDHNPPHFHAQYGDLKAVIAIKDFALLEGKLPAKTLGLVIEWAVLHQEELMNNWNLMQESKPMLKIAPLQ
ncbi:MAG: DUF4160 domain-containing protein [Spirosomataceae bacterium]